MCIPGWCNNPLHYCSVLPVAKGGETNPLPLAEIGSNVGETFQGQDTEIYGQNPWGKVEHGPECRMQFQAS